MYPHERDESVCWGQGNYVIVVYVYMFVPILVIKTLWFRKVKCLTMLHSLPVLGGGVRVPTP